MTVDVQSGNQGAGTGTSTGQGTVDAGVSAPAASPQPAGTGAPAASVAAQGTDGANPNQGKVGGGKNLVIPEHAMKRIKEEHFTKGKKEAMSALAKELGYSSPEEMQGAMKALRTKGESNTDSSGSPKPETKSDGKNGSQSNKNPGVDRQAWAKMEREQKRWTEEREQLLKQVRTESSKRKDLQQALDAKDAEMALRETAVLSGVKDVDYAIRLLTRNLDGKTEKDLAAFDEAKFFTELRTSHPYLFGEVVKPATTGTGANGNPPAPKPGAVSGTAAAGNQVDAKNMSREAFLQLLQSRGLNPGP